MSFKTLKINFKALETGFEAFEIDFEAEFRLDPRLGLPRPSCGSRRWRAGDVGEAELKIME